jgi:HK97 family phage major capsid protein
MSATATISPEVTNQLVEILTTKYGLVTQTQLDKAVLDIVQRAEEKYSDQKGARRNTFSLSTMLRGLRAMKGECLNESTREQDIQYVRALTTGSSPGSILVPTIQAAEIIQFLETGGIARSAGFRIWDLAGIQKMNVPVATGVPTWVWMAQNSQQTPTDPNLSQMSFDLKERRALIAAPNQLIAVSVPSFDVMLSEMLGLGAAAHEDTAIFSATTVSGGPTALLQAAGISTINCAGSANGGNIGFSDIVAMLAKAAAVKAAGPFVWFASPRTFYSRIFSLMDTTSRPLFIPTLTQGLQNTGIKVGSTQSPVGMLMGSPIYISPYLPENETLGSGSAQSHLILMNPKYGHLAQSGGVEIMVSLERYFDQNQTAIKAVTHNDTGYQPAAGIIVLLGVN